MFPHPTLKEKKLMESSKKSLGSKPKSCKQANKVVKWAHFELSTTPPTLISLSRIPPDVVQEKCLASFYKADKVQVCIRWSDCTN